MADAFSVRCLFIFLLINACRDVRPALSEDGTLSEADTLPSDNSIPTDKMMVRQPRYKCLECEGGACGAAAAGGGVCRDALSCFKSSVRAEGGVRVARGCFASEDHHQLTCWTGRGGGMHRRHLGQVNITCCKADLCNDGEFPLLPPPDTSMEPLGSGARRLWGALAAAAVLLAAGAAAAAFVVRRSHKLRLSRAALHKLGVEPSYYPTNMYSCATSPFYDAGPDASAGATLKLVPLGDSTLQQYLEASGTSGSGAGLPLMLQRTLAKQVPLVQCVGKGRFGEVWRGLWYSDSVAVKIFFSRDEASWRRETEIYSTALLRHENILAYIGSDMTSRNSCTQLWLITHYHPLGSLHEHLSRAALTRRQALLVCLSVANGLLHLHTEIHGTQGKPAIAHRDIKSKNILVKNNGECCIADFGLAATRAHLPPPAPAAAPAAPAPAPAPPQGTKRYMAPELLDHSMDQSDLEAHLRADMYSLALVLWEVVWRTRCPPRPPRDYRVPYAAAAPADPSYEDMRKIVCVDAARPDVPHCEHETLIGITRVMQECWHARPAARLPALRVKKTLARLAQRDAALSGAEVDV